MNQKQWRDCPKMNREEWLKWRRQGIGSSDAAVIMNGKHFGKDIYQLWEEKVFGNSEEFDNPAMQRGRALEEVARICFGKVMDVLVFPRNIENLENPWLRSSLDGMCLDDKTVVEIKCPNKEDHLSAISKKVPDKYIAQCQHQLAVTGLEKLYYYSFDGTSGITVEVRRDEDYIRELIEKEEIFWNCVISKTAPEEIADMKESLEWEEFQEKWERANQINKDSTSEIKVLKDQMIALSRGRNAIGTKIKLSKSICKGNVDYEAAIADYLANLRAHHPEITFPDIPIEAYRKKSFVKWTIRDI